MASDSKKNLRNLVIYQIFTRNYRGGTFADIQADLERIRALGTDYIYLLPIQPSGVLHRKGSMGSPYAIADYRAVDPVQGTMADFIRLTEAVHAAGMKIMIDVVYNHTSPDSRLSQEHPEWFYRKADGDFGNRIGDWWDVIDLDYSHEALWDYQIETLKMWAQYVDGFRCDVAPMIPLEFWLRARREVAEIRPDCLWLAESVEPGFIRACRREGIPMASDGELYQAFDILYDYDIYPCWTGLLTGQNDLQTYLDYANLQEINFPDNFCKLRFLENHDRNRAAAFFPDENELRSWTAWIFFATGTTMLYAGQEFCARRHPTLFDRDTAQFDTGRDISAYLSRLAQIKKDAIFAQGSFHAQAIGRNRDVILAIREMPERKCVGIFPTTAHRQVLTADIPDGTYTDAISGRAVDVFEKTLICDGEAMILFID